MLKQDGCSDSRGCRIIASMCLYKYTLQPLMYCLGIVWSREHEPLCWGSISTVVSALPKEFGAYTEPQGVLVASSPGHSQIYLAAVEKKNWEKAWDQNYVMNRKWWTLLVCNVDLV